MPQTTSAKSTSLAPHGELRRVLTYWDAVALIAGIMIGSGIFATPPQIAGSLDRFGPMLSVWLLGGLVAMCGALCYAELSGMFPRTGGAFIFQREIYGRPVAFVSGWSSLLITYPSSIAAIATVFAIYFRRLIPGVALPESVIAAILSLVFCGLNIAGVVLGARIQRTLTFAKVGALVSLVVFAIFYQEGSWSNLTPVWSAPSGGWQIGAFALAMASVMWTYEGWADGPTIAGEVRDLRRDMPRALIIGTGLVTLVYILLNTAYVYVMSIPGIAASDSVAVDMAQRTMGQYGGLFVTLLILASTAGSVNGSVIGASRVCFAMSREGLFFESVGRVHKRLQTPANALMITGGMTTAYCLLGTFDQLIRYFVFIAMLWFLMNIVGVFILRIRRPDADRPFRVPGYPFTPAVFIIVIMGLVYQLLAENTRDSLIGLGVLVMSFPTYWIWQKFHKS